MSRWSLEVLALGGILIVTQWIAFGLGFYQFTETPRIIVHWILLFVDLGAIVGLLVLVSYVGARIKDKDA